MIFGRFTSKPYLWRPHLANLLIIQALTLNSVFEWTLCFYLPLNAVEFRNHELLPLFLEYSVAINLALRHIRKMPVVCSRALFGAQTVIQKCLRDLIHATLPNLFR